MQPEGEPGVPVFEKAGKYVLFVHIPKAGGTTIEHIFRQNHWNVHLFDGGDTSSSLNNVLKCSPQHWHAAILKDVLRLNSFAAELCTIRHPIDRIKSEYRWRRKHFGINKIANDWIAAAIEEFKRNPFVHDNHIRPQSEFILPSLQVFRIEDGIESIFSFLNAALKEEIRYDKNYIAMRSETVETDNIDLSDTLKCELNSFYCADIELWESLK
jgi:hypothetical protein